MNTDSAEKDKLFIFLQNVQCDIKTIKPYIPDIHYGKVIKVYDGDTITIATCLYNGPNRDMYKFVIRILGVDTPEIKTKNSIERQKAILVRDALSTILLQKVVTLTDISYDKYGRILCNVYLDTLNISEWLIKNHYAVPYYGGTKDKNWEELN